MPVRADGEVHIRSKFVSWCPVSAQPSDSDGGCRRTAKGVLGNVQDVRQTWAARMSEPLLGEQTAWAGADEEGNS